MTRVSIILLACLLSACTSMGQLEKSGTSLSSEEVAFILGVSPEGYRTFIYPGSVTNGKFIQKQWTKAAFVGHPENGFIVGKMKVGDTLAVTNITAVKDKDSIFGRRFIACTGNRTIVFTAPSNGGKMFYMGNINYEIVNGNLSIKHGTNIEAARQHIEKHHPSFAHKVEDGNYNMMPIIASCTEAVYIPTPTRIK